MYMYPGGVFPSREQRQALSDSAHCQEVPQVSLLKRVKCVMRVCTWYCCLSCPVYSTLVLMVNCLLYLLILLNSLSSS